MDFSKLKPSDLKFFKYIADARAVNFDINKIVKKDPVKQEEKRKILLALKKILDDNQIVEAGFLMFKKNKLIRIVMKFLLNYYIKCFDKIDKNDDNEPDLLFD